MQTGRMYFPARLRQARISRGLSMQDPASSLDISRQAISQYEVGTIEPSDSTMRSIVDALKYPLEYFKKPMPEISENITQSIVFYRKQKGAPSRLKEAAEVRLSQFVEIDMYFRKFVDFPEIDISKFPIYSDIDINNLDPEDIAKRLRGYWNLGNGPISNLCLLLEKKGFMISTIQNESKKIDAFSRWYKNGIPYIFYGSENQSCSRYRFDLAHELGHLIMHAHFTEDEAISKEAYDRMEEEANRFAGAFLLPADSFAPEIYSSSIDHFLMLKKKWKVSVSAMIYRAQYLNLLSISQITYLKNQMTMRKYWRKEPYDDDMKIEMPVGIKQSLDLLIENCIITKSDFMNTNPYYPEELETICFFDKGTLQESISNDLAKVIKLKF